MHVFRCLFYLISFSIHSVVYFSIDFVVWLLHSFLKQYILSIVTLLGSKHYYLLSQTDNNDHDDRDYHYCNKTS